jgi:quercetin dioxygenase-like cupin family protein
MKLKPIFALFSAAILIAAFAAEQPPGAGVIHLNHDTVAGAFAKGAPLLATNNFKAIAGRRTSPGEVEIHARDTDIFYVVEGTAIFVTGGEAVGLKSSGPNESRAKEITGGQERRLVKGDVIVIPKGVPHWFKEIVQGPFLYLMVKVAD